MKKKKKRLSDGEKKTKIIKTKIKKNPTKKKQYYLPFSQQNIIIIITF